MSEVLTLSKLFVLGLLAQHERHGYELVTIADRWAIHRWAGVSIGSIYSTLKRLSTEKQIEPIRSEQANNRPSRLIYRLTEAGFQNTIKFVEEGLGSLHFESRELDLALAFAHLIPKEVRVQRLRDRLNMMVERRDQLIWLNQAYVDSLHSDDPALAQFRSLRQSDPWIYAGIRHGLARIRIEEAWTNELIQEIDTWPYTPVNPLHWSPKA